MKKIFIVIFILSILISCAGTSETEVKDTTETEEIITPVEETYIPPPRIEN